MKKIFSYALMMIATMVAFTSCESDLDSNPTLVTPTEFTVNNPSVGDALVDLEKSTSVQLTWSQPKFTTMHAPLSAQYQVQLSTTGNFTKQYDDESDDNSAADFIAIDETSTSCKADVPTKDIAKCLQKLTRWAEDAVPAEQKVSVRIRAFVANASMETLSEVCSNVVSFNAVPYYVELKDAVPTMWYLVGNMFGAKWANNKSIGEDALPMFMIPDYEYDKKTGAGEIEYTNYFLTGDYNEKAECDGAGFKILPADFNWDYSMNAILNNEISAKKGTIENRNGGGDGGHIVASEAGYYTITLNTANNTAKMEKYEGAVKDYGTIQITGSFNDWVDTPMLPYNTEGVENHAWYYVMTVPAGDPIQFKFKIADSWDTNWGFGDADGDINYCGTAGAGGKNMGLGEGKYVISFNDLTGRFSIVKL